MQKSRKPLLNRRNFMASTAAGASVLALPGGSFGQQGGGKRNTVRYPLNIPPIISATASIAANQGVVDLGGGKLSTAWVYNGEFPGPTFEANIGDIVDVLFTNNLSEATTVHWHGMIVPHDMDGHPEDLVNAGQSYRYQYPIIQRACLNWYHPHPDGRTGPQVAFGLAGAFIVRDSEEAALHLPQAPYEVPLVLRDANFDRNGNLRYNPKESGFLGSTPLVNGTRSPKLDVATEVYRFRVLGGANARVFRLALSNGSPMTLIGNDGGLLEFPANVSQIELGPGERLDLLIDFRGKSVGTKIRLVDLNQGWDLLEFVVATAVTPMYSIPAGRLSTIVPLTAPVRERNFMFEGMSRINGLEFDVNRIDFTVPFGQTELWRFSTGGNGPHPVHIHGMSFQVLRRIGGRGMRFPWESGWKDTVLVQDGETVEVLVRFDAYANQLYLLHCHQLEHEDNGMMSNFMVEPLP